MEDFHGIAVGSVSSSVETLGFALLVGNFVLERKIGCGLAWSGLTLALASDLGLALDLSRLA